MPDLIANYLIGLQSRLEKKMPTSLAEEHVREMGIHIRDSVASHLANGNSDQEATVAALRALGSESVVAEGLIRQYLGLNTKSAWWFAWLPCMAIVCYGLVPWSINEVEFPAWIETFVTWNVIILISSFCYACWRSRRFLMKPVALTLGLVFILTLINFTAFSSAGFTQRSIELRKRIVTSFDQNIRDDKAEIASAEQMLHDALQGKVGLASRAPSWSTVENEMGIAGIPFTIKGPPTAVLELKQVTDPAEAKTLWIENGKGFLKQLHQDLTEAVKNQKVWLDFKSDPSWLRNLAWSTGKELVLFSAILATLNALVLAGLRASLIIRSRLWRPSKVV